MRKRATRPIVGFANRLPIVKGRKGWTAAPGGLVSSLRPVLEARNAAWVGWSGGAEPAPRRVDGVAVDLHSVELTPRELAGYYYGFSNRTLWPLLHSLIEQPVLDMAWWGTYREVNRRFAGMASTLHTPGRQPPLMWVHDYHLLLLPEMLRSLHPKSLIVSFLHTPFPSPELFARLPWRSDILRGMLGADVVAFHTENYRDNFARTCGDYLDDVKILDGEAGLPDGRRVRISVHPISIDAEEFTRAARDPRVDRELNRLRTYFQGRKVILGTDRLDYTKGIQERLRAIELLLERRPDLRRRITFVQIAVPSRDDVKEYRELRAHVESEVGRINGRFTQSGHDVPVRYLYRSVPKHVLLAYYILADVALVTPLKDGMNLVAKEYAVCQAAREGSGALVLSEFAGAAIELRDAFLCNPFDIEGLSKCIEDALESDEDDRRQRIERMAGIVRGNDVFAWADGLFNEAETYA